MKNFYKKGNQKINLSIKDIYEAVLGKNPKSIEFLKNKFRTISINSKKIKKDDIFVAIKGMNFDGHDYLDEAFKNGAIAAIISNEEKISSNTILVNDTKKSLSDIASFILKKFNPFIIGIISMSG